jgi:hypothetical protein
MQPMRPKASGLDQHGRPRDWLEESDLAGVIFSVPFGTGCPDRICPAAS